jgi:tetratricopeptide (TPR) repeat protein
MSDAKRRNASGSRRLNGESAKPSASRHNRSLRRTWVTIRFPVVSVVVLIVIFIWFTNESSNRLLRQAQGVAEADPVEAERLLERCLGGRPNFPEAQLLRCQVLGRLGYWDEAQGLFHLIKRPHQLSGTELLQFSRQALNAGRSSLAQSIAEVAVGEDSSQIEATQLLLQIAVQQGRQEESLELSLKLASHTPNDPLPWQVMAKVYQDRRQSPEAISAYRKALKFQQKPDEQFRIQISLAHLLLEQGELSAARETIRPLLERPSPSYDAKLLEANILRVEGRIAEAITLTEHILEENPNRTSAIFLRGLLYSDDGRLEAARDDLKKVVLRHPSQGEAYFKLAQIYQRLGDSAQAELMLKRSHRLVEDTAELGRLTFELASGPLDDVKAQRYQQLSRELQGK